MEDSISGKIGLLFPSPDKIAQAIAKRDNARILPTGNYAMNLLGLSTQVPMNVVYLTDGSPRKVNIGRRKLLLKKLPLVILSIKGK
jgi:hypothetical protein